MCMMNNFIVVGRITSFKAENKKGVLELIVSRNYKNVNGDYEEDIIKINVFDGLNNNIKNFCCIGDIVGVRGRIQSNNRLVAEKISFLKSNSEK